MIRYIIQNYIMSCLLINVSRNTSPVKWLAVYKLYGKYRYLYKKVSHFNGIWESTHIKIIRLFHVERQLQLHSKHNRIRTIIYTFIIYILCFIVNKMEKNVFFSSLALQQLWFWKYNWILVRPGPYLGSGRSWYV